MTSIKALKVGDVLRVTDFYTDDLAVRIGGYPIYAVVSSNETSSSRLVRVDFCVPVAAQPVPKGVSDGWLLNDRDVFTVIPEDEYPDEVLGWIAQRAMS